MAAEKERRGRPPLDPSEVRSHWFNIRVNHGEIELLEQAGAGRTSSWAREVLLRAARRAVGRT